MNLMRLMLIVVITGEVLTGAYMYVTGQTLPAIYFMLVAIWLDRVYDGTYR